MTNVIEVCDTETWCDTKLGKQTKQNVQAIKLSRVKQEMKKMRSIHITGLYQKQERYK